MLRQFPGWLAAVCALVAVAAMPAISFGWSEDQFEHRPLFAYPMPPGHDGVIGDLTPYQIQKGDTLLDVGRFYGLSAKEVSDANDHLDWWTPAPGKEITLPTEHILPDGPRAGIVLNIPEMRLYYYSHPGMKKHGTKDGLAAASDSGGEVVYTFPVGLGRYDWKTPIGDFKVRGKTRNPTWVVPEDIYEEHLERDGEADHVVEGGDPDNPLGLFRIELTLNEYALHGTNNPWGIGMEVSHGCIRLYPEDIESLFKKVAIGTPGRFVYEPVKFGWRGDALYVEVHDDLYAKYPGAWNHAIDEVKRRDLGDQVDFRKLEKAVEAKSGVPTFVGLGPPPGSPPADESVDSSPR